MSSTSAPFGLRPVSHISGVIRDSAYSILDGYTSGILQNQPVKIGTDGYIQAAAIGDRFVGTFQGVEYTDSDGKRRVSNKWTASQVGADSVAYISLNPSITYEIQSNAALVITDIGKQYDFTTITAGSTTTGLSQLMLDVSSSAVNASLQVVGLSPYADNAWGDTYVIVQVRISEHQLVADIAAF